MFKKSFVLFYVAFLAAPAMGIELRVDPAVGTPRGLVIIAPAKKYLMGERLFSELARQLSGVGYVTVRFDWAPDTLLNPELEIQRASRDIHSVVHTAQQRFGFDSAQTVLISKSFSTRAVAASIPPALIQILLTPNCSVEAPFRSVYTPILNRRDFSVRIFISREDPFCDVEQIQRTWIEFAKTFSLSTSHGDHNFVSIGPSGDLSFLYQDQIIQEIAQQLR